jgi:hypothetical protein
VYYLTTVKEESINWGGISMPWPCRIVEAFHFEGEPGDMYQFENGDWHVRLPNGGIVNIHSKFRDGSSWTVTGEAPNFTVNPSIRCFESKDKDGVVYRQGWHGYLQNGVLTDDLEGNVFRGETDVD